MRNHWTARILCLLAVIGLLIACGCNAFTPRRQRRRSYAIRTNLDRAVDDVDWMLGLHRPTSLYDETMR